MEPFNQNFQNLLFLINTLRHFMTLCEKRLKISSLFKVHFEFLDSLKNNGTKYLLTFDNSCEEICNSKAFVDFATAGSNRGLSTIYIKHNLFYQSKLGRDSELQNMHIVLFKSPPDVV